MPIFPLRYYRSGNHPPFADPIGCQGALCARPSMRTAQKQPQSVRIADHPGGARRCTRDSRLGRGGGQGFVDQPMGGRLKSLVTEVGLQQRSKRSGQSLESMQRHYDGLQAPIKLTVGGRRSNRGSSVRTCTSILCIHTVPCEGCITAML